MDPRIGLERTYVVPYLCAGPTPPTATVEEKGDVGVPFIQQLVLNRTIYLRAERYVVDGFLSRNVHREG